jgi:hypothetical protein
LIFQKFPIRSFLMGTDVAQENNVRLKGDAKFLMKDAGAKDGKPMDILKELPKRTDPHRGLVLFIGKNDYTLHSGFMIRLSRTCPAWVAHTCARRGHRA